MVSDLRGRSDNTHTKNGSDVELYLAKAPSLRVESCASTSVLHASSVANFVLYLNRDELLFRYLSKGRTSTKAKKAVKLRI